MAKVQRVILTVRISPDGLAALDQRAEDEGRSRSDTARLLLAYAIKRMPRGWKP